MSDIKPVHWAKPAVRAVLESVLIRPQEKHERYAAASVRLYDEDGSDIQLVNFEGLTKEDLDPWGEDDSVVVAIVLAKLGIELAE